MRYGSVCSGIEAASVAWGPLGWHAAWFSEIEEFPCRVLKYRFKDVPNLGDMTKIYDKETFKQEPIDLLVGGTPCQPFSLAGERKGLGDPRGDLALEFLRIAKIKKPRWFVWENVPGVLSSNEGKDFGSFLRSIQKLGYGFAYRVLDAKNFGVPQSRRRVFVVGYLGDWRPAVKVLFDGESGGWDSTSLKDGIEGKSTVIEIGASTHESHHTGRVAATIKAGYYKCWNDLENTDNLVLTERKGLMYVQRLKPRECEKLQGFPVDYTNIPGASDGVRYKAIGNSMAVPVMCWIGRRINQVDLCQNHSTPCTKPEPDDVGEYCVHCGWDLGDWGDNGMWVHTGESCR
jgi:DNA (cytosine-5)-methyltransferase 1